MKSIYWQIVGYGLLLVAGTLLLQWLDYRWLVRAPSLQIYGLIIAALFLAVGVAIGAGALRRPAPVPLDGNPRARASLGISARELEVLQELAAGHSNKEIARRLDIAPDTVKTHVSRLYQKLEARRRTDAVLRARELGILP
jgi:DNA-binding CsgD family transcriptional regulator